MSTHPGNKSTAVRRIMQELKELMANPDPMFTATYVEDNLFDWHFTIRGASDSDFQGGIYHGRIVLPAEYPFKPPDIYFFTPSGRFETNTKICLSISGFHPKTWQPSWGIRTILTATIAFMMTPGEGAVGALDWPKAERQRLAIQSLNYCCSTCGKRNQEILPPMTPEDLAAASASTTKTAAATPATTSDGGAAGSTPVTPMTGSMPPTGSPDLVATPSLAATLESSASASTSNLPNPMSSAESSSSTHPGSPELVDTNSPKPSTTEGASLSVFGKSTHLSPSTPLNASTARVSPMPSPIALPLPEPLQTSADSFQGLDTTPALRPTLEQKQAPVVANAHVAADLAMTTPEVTDPGVHSASDLVLLRPNLNKLSSFYGTPSRPSGGFTSLESSHTLVHANVAEASRPPALEQSVSVPSQPPLQQSNRSVEPSAGSPPHITAPSRTTSTSDIIAARLAAIRRTPSQISSSGNTTLLSTPSLKEERTEGASSLPLFDPLESSVTRRRSSTPAKVEDDSTPIRQSISTLHRDSDASAREVLQREHPATFAQPPQNGLLQPETKTAHSHLVETTTDTKREATTTEIQQTAVTSSSESGAAATAHSSQPIATAPTSAPPAAQTTPVASGAATTSAQARKPLLSTRAHSLSIVVVFCLLVYMLFRKWSRKGFLIKLDI